MLKQLFIQTDELISTKSSFFLVYYINEMNAFIQRFKRLTARVLLIPVHGSAPVCFGKLQDLASNTLRVSM